MTTIDLDTGAALRPRPRFSLLMRLRRLLVQMRQHRRAVRGHIELSRLDDRLLYDLGLDPLDLHAVHKLRLPPSMLLDAMRRNLDSRLGPRP